MAQRKLRAKSSKIGPTPRARIKALRSDLRYAKTYWKISCEDYHGWRRRVKKLCADLRALRAQVRGAGKRPGRKPGRLLMVPC